MTTRTGAGRNARTRFMVLARAGKVAAWTALMPLTGRTHQLRAHAVLIGCPILGDGKYGGKDAHPTGAPKGLMLHARELDLPGAKRGTAAPDGRAAAAVQGRPALGRPLRPGDARRHAGRVGWTDGPSKSPKLIVFDCDGTLVDSQATIVTCAQAAFRAAGLTVPSAEAVRRIVGLSLVEAMHELLPEAGPGHGGTGGRALSWGVHRLSRAAGLPRAAVPRRARAPG